MTPTEQPTTTDQAPADRYTASDVCRLSGATYRQLDHWDRTDTLVPTWPAEGSGSQRGYSPHDLLVATALTMLAAVSAHGEALRLAAASLADLPAPWDGWLVVAPSGQAYLSDDPRPALVHRQMPVAWVLDLSAVRLHLGQHG